MKSSTFFKSDLPFNEVKDWTLNKTPVLIKKVLVTKLLMDNITDMLLLIHEK